jgi:hypothetical protein
MAISNTVQSMRKSLSRRGAELAKMQARRAELARFANLEALLEAVDPDSALSNAERGRVLAALVAEHQTHGGELAQSVLVVALERSLTATRARLRHMRDEELDQVVLHAFLEALALAGMRSAGSYVAVSLALETKRIVKRMMRPAREAPRALPYEEKEHEACDRPGRARLVVR